MARPRTFNDRRALDAAVRCFWQHGYEATSVRELSASMGICGPSLYNAFGDKRTLFVSALERYLDTSTRMRIKELEETLAPKDAVKRFINNAVERAVADRDRRGCFLINSALEVAPHDPDLAPVIAERLGEIEAFFCRSIKAAQREGTVSRDRKAKDLARLLLGVLLGVGVLARAKPDRELLEGVARPALALLD